MAFSNGEVVGGAIRPLFEARVFAYDVLMQAFIEEPGEGFLKDLRQDDVLQAFPFAEDDPVILEGITQVRGYINQGSIPADEIYDNIHWDYTRMFIGPSRLPAPPWESAYLTDERLLFTQETLEVRKAYLEYGLLPKNYPHEADDHLGFELDFMRQLSQMAKERLERKDTSGLVKVLEDQKEFLEEHLLKWVPALVEDIAKSAATDFYRGMANILGEYLRRDLELIKELLAKGERW